ncbi:hypothetical protein STENM223S_04872 [Streptomyces tendae]
MPELREQGFIEILDRVYRTGRPCNGWDTRVLLGRGPEVREAFVDFTCEPRLDAGGNVMGVRVIGVETTRIKHAQRLTAEHRVLLEQIARQARCRTCSTVWLARSRTSRPRRCSSPCCWPTPTAGTCATAPPPACPPSTTRPSTASPPERASAPAAPPPTGGGR